MTTGEGSAAHRYLTWPRACIIAAIVAVVLELSAYCLPLPTPLGYAGALVASIAALLAVPLLTARALPDIPTRGERLSWWAINTGVALRAAGTIIWLVTCQQQDDANAFPTWGDVPAILAYIPLWLGLLRQPSLQTRDRYSRLVLLLEMFISMLVLLTMLWFLSIGPALQHTTDISWTAKALILAFPAFDVATLICVIVLIFRSHLYAFGLSRTLLGLGALLLTFTDSIFVGGHFSGVETVPWWLYPLWVVAYLLFGLATQVQATMYFRGTELYPDIVVLPSRWRMLVPYTLVTVTIIMLVATYYDQGQNAGNNGLLLGSSLVLFLVILHQWLTFEENRKLYHELRDAYQETAMMAQTDPITQLYNYRYFIEHLRDEINRAERYHLEVSLLFADLDLFKQVNDTYGHLAGDEVLIAVGQALQQQIRSTDIVARYAGEEFVILLRQTALPQAIALAERLRCSVAALRVPVGKGQTITPTISIGVSAYPTPSATLDALIRDADAAMYQVKEAGRNGVQCAASPTKTAV